MELLLTGGKVYQSGAFVSADVAVSDGRIVSVSPSLPRDGYSVVEVNDCWIVPGFVDVHFPLWHRAVTVWQTTSAFCNMTVR